MNWITSLISGLASPIVDGFKSVQARKQAKESAKSKIKLAKQTGDFNLQMTDTEWEALGKNSEAGSWKDEWVTLVITLPIPVIFFAAIYSAYTGDPTYLNAVNAGVNAVLMLMPNFATVLEIVVYAAVSIKGVSSLTR